MRQSALKLQTRALLVWGLLSAATAAAAVAAPATSQFVALLDLDDNPSTGCTVTTANGPFKGVEQMLVTTVDLTQSPPRVISVARQACTNPGTNTFGAAIPITSPFAPPWSVGVGDGTSGSEVVETYLPLGSLSVGTTIRFGFTANVVGGTGVADATLTTNGQPSGLPILLSATPIAAVPTLGAVGLVLLGLLLAGCALLLLRRGGLDRRGRGAVAGLLLLTLGLGVSGVGMAFTNITPDGSVGDWSGLAPIATDPAGDAPINADMLAQFAVVMNDTLFIRFDARIVGLPAVTSTTPANGAVNVAGTTPITINFNEPVNVTASTFSVQCPSGTPVPFTVSPAPPGNASTFTLTPSAALPGGVACAVVVAAAKVTDDEGLQPAADYDLSFTTDGPPAVTSTTPANGASQVALAAPITVNFSKAVNVTASAFTLECPAGTPEPFTLSPAPPGGASTFTLTPTGSLPQGTVCTVTVVASQVTDVSVGTHMTANYVFSYTTDTAPTVSSTTPADGATAVALNGAVTINFSKAVNVSGTAFKLECPTGTPEAFTVSPAPPGGAATFTLTPTANLPAGTTCTVTVVASQVSDVAAATPLAANFVFSYTTDVAPTVTSTTPANAATQQSPTTTIAITFSKAVTVSGTAFKLECPAGTPEAFTVSPPPPPAGGATTFTLTPTANLPASTTCTVTVVASQVADVAAGTNLAADFVFTFTTGNPPAVSSTTPANGAISVLASSTITITFNKAVNATASAFKLECPAGTPQAFTTSPATTPPAATIFTLTPAASLPAGTTCTVTVVAAQITDPVSSLHPNADYVLTFTVDTPPTVSATVPANGATLVAGNSTVTVTFSKAVNVNASSFTLQCPSGTPVAFTLSPAPPGGVTAFTLTPTANLPAGTTCTVTAVANQIADLAGTNLAANFVFSFSTDAAPTVTSTTPAASATSVPLNSTVTFTFNKAVNVTASSFTLQCPSGTPVAFTLSPAPPGGVTTYTLTPSANLPASTVCVATAVAAQIKDTIGTNLASNFTLSFTTDTPPAVTTTTPASGAVNVVPSATITVNFSKAVTVTGTAFTLQCPTGTPEAFTVTPASPSASFTLTPSASLPVTTVCTVTAVAAQITDAAGTNPTANFTFSFTTATPPTVTSTTPANGATAVLASSALSITFSHAVNVTGTAFTLQCPTGTPETFTLSPAAPGGVATFTLTPTAPLPAGAVCTATAVASQITDSSTGVNMAANFVWSFTVDTPPTVTSTSPVNGATSVAGNTAVTVTFSKAVNVTASAFTLQCPTGTPAAFTLSPAPPGGATTFTLTPSANLPAGTTCTVTAVANQIADLAGTNLAANFVFSFSTDAAPTVTSTTPAASATAVPLNSTVTFTFNKAVNVTASSFTLQCPSGTPVAFTLSPAPPGGVTTYTLTPSANLPASTLCVATAVAAQIKDTVGTNLASNFTLSFTTDTPPAVTTTTPASGAINVAPSTTITVNFSKPVTVTGTAFTLQCPTGTPEAFTVTPASPSASFTLTPSAALPVNTVCTVTAVAAQITDAAGTNPTANFTFSFTTATPPTVTSTTPANGATAVLTSSALSITFSHAVNVTASAFTLQCPTGTPESLTISPAPPGGVATFTLTPTAPLPAGTVCTATAVASQITDSSSGVNLAANFVWSFTTDTAPTVTSTSPVNGATTQPLNSTVTFTFNKAVNVTASAFTLQCPTGTPEAFTLSPAPPGGVTTYTLTPSAALPAGTVCTATAVASQITDLAGTHLAANVSTSFTTDTPPTVTSTTPASGATAVLANTTVSITFSKAVNVTGTAFTLQCPTGTPEGFTVSPTPPGGATTFTLTPSANLPAGAVCTTTVVASQVTDTTEGTPLAANFVFSFTIDTPPTVSSTIPANGTSNFVDTAALSFTFNKAVNVTASAFTLQCPTGTPVTFALSPAPPGGVVTFTLTPSTHLPPNVTCSASAVASQIADLAGTNMAADDTITFATVPPPPVANPDTYPETVIGNVSVSSSVLPFSVTTNDTSQTAFTITAFDATSANGGTVSMTTSGAGMGQFTYNPPAGFTGTDTFTYTITNTGGSNTATVSLSVAGMIWFINDAASAGDGRLASPFNSLAAFQAINDGVGRHAAANQNIFLYDSATAYSGPVTLLNGQKLIGQDATSSLSTITGLTPGVSSAALPATGGGSPNKVQITSSGNTVTLGSGNTVWGLTLGNSTGTALTGASVGSLKLRDMTISTSGAAVSLANGALDAILNSVSSASGTHGIALTTTTGSFDVEGGGASDPANTTKGRTTAKNGGGTITLGSGGTIQNATSAGVLLSSATNVTLRNLVIQNNGGAGVATGGDGIDASGSSGLTLDNDLITGQTGNYGLFASSLATLSIQHTQISSNATNAAVAGNNIWNVGFGQVTCTTCPDGLTGTSAVANSIFDTTFEDAFGLVNHNASTLALTVTNSQFSNAGNTGLESQVFNTANVTLSVTTSSVHNNPGGGVEYLGNDSSGGGTFTVTSSVFDQNGGAGAADINVFHQGLSKTVKFDFENNTTRQTLVANSSASISVDLGGSANASTLLEGKILNNIVGKASVTDSGSDLSSGIALQTNAPGTITALITGNMVVQTDDDALLVLATSETTSNINVTASGNDFEVSPTDPDTNLGLELTSGGSGGSDTICANISGNVKEIGNSGVAGIATEVLGTSTVELQGYGGTANNNAQIATFLNGTATTVSPAGMNFGGGGTVKAAPSPCPTPP
jgi:methionine-rich copper-binding protein CopC